MIEELVVKGIGGIRCAELSFYGNFIVITGESGAGKSSLVRALEFITGKKANAADIHLSEESCDVQLMIGCGTGNPALAKLCGGDVQAVVIRRVFNRNGRGKCTIQGNLVSLSSLQAAMEREVVIQSQFAQLSLIDPARQLELVDSCGGTALAKAAEKLRRTFNGALEIEKKLLSLKKQRMEKENKFKDAGELIKRINKLELKDNSDVLWTRELKELEKKACRAASLRKISERFYGSALSGGVFDMLEALSKDIYENFKTEENGGLRDSCEKLLSDAQNLESMLRRELADAGADDGWCEAREKLEKKLGTLRKIKRTLNLPTCKDVVNYAAEAEAAVEWMKNIRSDIEALENHAKSLKKEISHNVLELRALRKEAANRLTSRVNRYLSELGMEYASFDILIEEQDKVRAAGAERVVFTISMNGQQPLPVVKNVSGGELSRILIALQLSLGDEKLPGTLVFDEVEAGLGGKTALLAGYKLKELAKRCRTVLITHQAAIAAMADTHFLVKREKSETYIRRIEGKDREREIARMLAGNEASKEAIEHAKSLLAAIG